MLSSREEHREYLQNIDLSPGNAVIIDTYKYATDLWLEEDHRKFLQDFCSMHHNWGKDPAWFLIFCQLHLDGYITQLDYAGIAPIISKGSQDSSELFKAVMTARLPNLFPLLHALITNSHLRVKGVRGALQTELSAFLSSRKVNQ